MKKRLIIIFIMLLCCYWMYPAHAEEVAESNSENQGMLESLQVQIATLQEKISELEETQSGVSGFQPHKPNFVLPLTWTTPIRDRMNQEIQFQFSLKQDIWEYQRFRFFYAYSQKSFWQAYDEENSSPFRESNYNPEVFIRSPNYILPGWGKWRGDLGYEHESNGREAPASRSWDRVFLRVEGRYDQLTLGWKGWYRIPESKKKSPEEAKGDDNPDIDKFYGQNQWTVGVDWHSLNLNVIGRYAIGENRGGAQVNFSFPTIGEIRGLVQYWDGFGESLTDYNRHFNKLGIGFLFSQ